MGSNPTGTTGPVAQWIARKTSNLKVAGSSPARVVLPDGVIGFEPYMRVKPLIMGD